jgi:hypothetical protein
VLRLVIDAVRADLRKQPERQNISISQADNGYFCQCDACSAINTREQSNMGALLTFVNAVAEAVEKEFPDVLIGTLAYQWSRKPPLHMQPRRNVMIQLCSIECCQMHALEDSDCPLNQPFVNDMRGWARLTGNISYWIYVTNFQNYLLPCPNLGTLGRNLRTLRDNSAIGAMMQGPWNGYGGDFAELKNYVLARLLWDPGQEEDALVREFVTFHYGSSAEGVMSILERIESIPLNGLHRHCFGNAGQYGMTPAHGRELVLMFADLVKHEEDPAARARLEKASICAWRLLAEPWWPRRRFLALLDAPVPAPELDPQIYSLFAVTPEPPLPGPVAATLQLCERHGVDRSSEGQSVGKVAEQMRSRPAAQETPREEPERD